VDQSPQPGPSFAEAALAGEDARRRAEAFPRPARQRFRRHAAIFVVVNLALALLNLWLWPQHLMFYYLTIVWAFVLGDNFLWAYVVDPDRDVAERAARRAARAGQPADSPATEGRATHGDDD
jgi:hypothetical protein